MLRLISLSLVSAVMLVACSSNPAPNQVRDEEYAVYDAVIREKYLRPKVQLVVVGEQTQNYRKDELRESAWDGILLVREASAIQSVKLTTIANYLSENGTQRKLENRFNLPVPVSLAAEQDRNKLFSESDLGTLWHMFYEKYPNSGGLLTLSRVGFDTARSQALVYISLSCGSLCGGEELYLLVKTEGAWRIKMARTLGVS